MWGLNVIHINILHLYIYNEHINGIAYNGHINGTELLFP